jgi:hypothetical protein
MNHPDSEAARHRQAAEVALARGDLVLAEHHLDAWESSGASPEETQRFREQLFERRISLSKNRGKQVLIGLAIAVFGYAALSLRTILDWTPAIWGVLSFVLIPGLAGAFVSRSAGPVAPGMTRFWRGFLLCFLTMGTYSAIEVVLAASRMASRKGDADVILIATVVTIAYGAIAGIVGGTIGSWLSKPKVQR